MNNSLPSTTAATEQALIPQGRRRRSPSASEQARRKAWGEKWGKLVADGYQRMIQERG